MIAPTIKVPPIEREVILGLALLICISGACFMLLVSEQYPLPISWRYQYISCSAILALLYIFQYAYRNKPLRIAITACKAVLISVILIPSFGTDPVSSLFAAILCTECFLDFGILPGIVLVMYFLGFLALVVFNPIQLWNIEPGFHKPLYVATSAPMLILGAVAGFLIQNNRYTLFEQSKSLFELRETNIRLAKANIRFQDVAAEIQEATKSMERTRIAREIHDSLGFTLTNVLALLNAYRERMCDVGEEVPEKITQARDLIRDGLVDLRTVLKMLRSNDAENQGAWDSIVKLVEVFRLASGIAVSLSFINVPPCIGAFLSEVFYHIVQEGLTNAFRHGKAANVEIVFRMAPEGIGLTIRDDGAGAQNVQAGYGLLGIQERIRALNGLFSVSTGLKAGFALHVSIPNREKINET